jgi:hypothetical protein
LRQHGIAFVVNAPGGKYTTPCPKCGKVLSVKYDSVDTAFLCRDCGFNRRPNALGDNGGTPRDDDERKLDAQGWREFADAAAPHIVALEGDLAIDLEIELKAKADGPFSDELLEQFARLARERPETFAHLYKRYPALAAALRLDAATVRAALESADKDDVVTLFSDLALVADLDPIETDALCRLVKQKSGVGLRPLQAKLKETQKQQAVQRARAERAKRLAERDDPRPWMDVPDSDAPWLPEMDTINATLGHATASAPPQRDIDGVATRGRKLAVPKMHAFSQVQANPDTNHETEDDA